ncbi:MAG: hypothetical protein AAB691_04540 [Patescibacteria group bacterium]
MKKLFFRYRILHWGEKISSLRPLGYTLFGYVFASHFSLLAMTLNLLLGAGILTASYFLNDYYDWKLQHERNFVSREPQVQKHMVWYFSFPLLISLAAGTILVSQSYVSLPSLAPLLLAAVLSFLYSFPPVRLKDRKGIHFFIFPVCVTLLFLASILMFGSFSKIIVAFSLIIFLYQCYLESLHQIQDIFEIHESRKLASPNQARRIAQILLGVYIGVALILSILINLPFFLISALFGGVRLLRLFQVRLVAIGRERRHIFSLLVSAEEYILYSFLLLVGLIQ